MCTFKFRIISPFERYNAMWNCKFTTLTSSAWMKITVSLLIKNCQRRKQWTKVVRSWSSFVPKRERDIFSIATLKKKGFCTLDLTYNPLNFQAWGYFDPSELQGIWQLLSRSDKGRSAINIKFRRKVKLLKSITLTISMLNKSIIIQTSAEEKEKVVVVAVLVVLCIFLTNCLIKVETS